jgi:hypothetical protein
MHLGIVSALDHTVTAAARIFVVIPGASNVAPLLQNDEVAGLISPNHINGST